MALCIYQEIENEFSGIYVELFCISKRFTIDNLDIV